VWVVLSIFLNYLLVLPVILCMWLILFFSIYIFNLLRFFILPFFYIKSFIFGAMLNTLTFISKIRDENYIFCSFLKTSNKFVDFFSLVILDLKSPFQILLLVSFCIHHLKAVCNGGCLTNRFWSMSGQQDGEASFLILSQQLKLVKQSARIAWQYWK
jgi:hypothetical protein